MLAFIMDLDPLVDQDPGLDPDPDPPWIRIFKSPDLQKSGSSKVRIFKSPDLQKSGSGSGIGIPKRPKIRLRSRIQGRNRNTRSVRLCQQIGYNL